MPQAETLVILNSIVLVHRRILSAMKLWVYLFISSCLLEYSALSSTPSVSADARAPVAKASSSPDH